MMYARIYDSPLGKLTLAEENGALIGLWMEGQRYFPARLQARWEKTPVLTLAEDWLNRYFAGERPGNPTFPMEPRGTEFQRQVWALLREIPYGKPRTYASIAEKIAALRGIPRMSARAVGSAVGHNPISILIPCHRVLGARGHLTGYAGGLERKQWLLDWETNPAVRLPGGSIPACGPGTGLSDNENGRIQWLQQRI